MITCYFFAKLLIRGPSPLEKKKPKKIKIFSLFLEYNIIFVKTTVIFTKIMCGDNLKSNFPKFSGGSFEENVVGTNEKAISQDLFMNYATMFSTS